MIRIGVTTRGIPIDMVIIGQIIIRITGAGIGMVITIGIIINTVNIITINVTGIVVEAMLETETVIVHGTIQIMIMDIRMECLIL